MVLTIRTMHDKEEQNVIIDWGDGSYTDLRNDAATDIKPTNVSKNLIYWPAWDANEGEYNVLLTHKYDSDGRYIIKIWGNTYWGVRCETEISP